MCILFFILWVVLNGRITAEILIFGAVVTVVMYLFIAWLFGYSLKTDLWVIRKLPYFAAYTGVLIFEIIKATMAVISVAFSRTKKPEPAVYEFQSGFKSRMQNVLLANSITLTPGTFTLFHKDGRFVIHCLRPEYAEGIEDSSFVHIISKLDPGELERIDMNEKGGNL